MGAGPTGGSQVVRLRSKDPARPNPLIILRFNGLLLPDRVFCGYLSAPVRPWTPQPQQCHNCWRFGHGDRACRARHPTCGRCGERHPTAECEAEALSCPSCKDPHSAWDRSCQAWTAAKAALSRRCPRPQRVTAPEEFPPLPAPFKGKSSSAEQGTESPVASPAPGPRAKPPQPASTEVPPPTADVVPGAANQPPLAQSRHQRQQPGLYKLRAAMPETL